MTFTKEQLIESIEKNFQHKTFNPGQKEAIAFAVLNLVKGKEHVILELPTGIGKSAVATTVHKVLRDLHDNTWRSTIITSTKGLQDQYVMEDKKIFSLKGKNNYPCAHTPGVTYGTPACSKTTNSGGCTPFADCEYVKKREFFLKHAPLRLTNTSFHIKAPPGMIAAVTEPTSIANLLVIDECHALDQNLVDSATIDLHADEIKQTLDSVSGFNCSNFFAAFNVEFEKYDDGQVLSNEEIREHAATLIGKLDGVVSEINEELQNGSNRKDKLVLLKESIQQYISVFCAITVQKKGEWIIEEYIFSQHIKLVPLYAYQVAHHGIFSKCKQFIHMSATICGPNEYMKTLGLNPDNCAYLSMPNPIPVDNRKIYALNALKVSGQFDQTRMAEVIDRIVSKHTSDSQNGIIHTVSFQLAEAIKKASKNKKRMIVSNQRDQILKWVKSPVGNVVLSPSIEVGYDFKGDMSRFQILAKVPFEYLGSKYVAENLRRSPKWYARRAILRIVQSAGRSIRGVDDWAITYILDSNFRRLYEDNPELFPEWFKEALVM